MSMMVLHLWHSGFLERTKGRGLVMCGWAPQLEILGHSSVGGFLTHCGWNSVLESVVKGVPMIAWPLFAEQRTNAALVTDGLKVSLRPKVSGNGIVMKEEIAKVVKTLMEGSKDEQVRKRMKHLQHFAASALKEDGSSTKALSSLACKWKCLE
jgi:hydroquinone glucosyltransferase